MANLVKISAKAPTAKMHVDVAPAFEVLRNETYERSGVDFLAVCGDVLRPANFKSSKPGVADRSWHKTGRAFDYDQASAALVIVGEEISTPAGARQFFRTYLICAKQDGSLGEFKKLRDYRGFVVTKYVVDFTALALERGFERIPAWAGWRATYTKREFWHYSKEDDLTWDQAMQQIKGRVDPAPRKAAVAAGKSIIGLNDRDGNTGNRVTLIQKALNHHGLLPSKEIDGIYGRHTLAAVRAFQRGNNLAPDGTVGPLTAAGLGISL